jgi:hypothetical protein
MTPVNFNKIILLTLLLCQVKISFSKNYYFDSNKGDDTNAGVLSFPWKTFEPLKTVILKPGDKVLFARGGYFNGVVVIKASGTFQKPIVFSCYGTGKAPEFTNAIFSVFNGNVVQVKGSFITIDGLLFSHTANYAGTAVDTLNKKGDDKKILLAGAVHQQTNAHHLTIINCEFFDCPIAINVSGQHNLITKNYLHDCNRYLWEPDWGPIGIFIANANNEVSYNKCINYKKEGGNFGADGGFIELDSRYFGGPIHHVYIHHNHSSANEGFLEITNSGNHLTISYNVSDDYQQFIFFWEGDSSKVENNTVIRTRPANSTVNTVFSFKHSGYLIRNNIFVLANGLQAFAGGAYDARNFNQLHENNIYFVVDKTITDPVGKPLGKGELVADPRFIDFKNANYHLQYGSVAIDAAQHLGYKKDFDNNKLPVGKKPDIGAYEFTGDVYKKQKLKK